jgi:hypothetical protein
VTVSASFDAVVRVLAFLKVCKDVIICYCSDPECDGWVTVYSHLDTTTTFTVTFTSMGNVQITSDPKVVASKPVIAGCDFSHLIDWIGDVESKVQDYIVEEIQNYARQLAVTFR